MSTDYKICLSACKFCGYLLFFSRRRCTDKQSTTVTKLFKKRSKIKIMLSCKDLSRSHKRSLSVILECDICRICRTHGFPRSDIARNESVHLHSACHIGFYFIYRALLCTSKLKRQRREKSLSVGRKKLLSAARFFTFSRHAEHKCKAVHFFKSKALFRSFYCLGVGGTVN